MAWKKDAANCLGPALKYAESYCCFKWHEVRLGAQRESQSTSRGQTVAAAQPLRLRRGANSRQ